MTRSGIGVGATLTHPLSSRYARASLPSSSRAGMEFVVPPKRDSSPRRVVARGHVKHLPFNEVRWRAEKRKPMVPRSLARPRRAPLGAPIAAVTTPDPAFPA
jgi:hypothetical protein